TQSMARADVGAALAKLTELDNHTLVRQYTDLQAELLCLRLVLRAEAGEDPRPFLKIYEDPSRYFSSSARDLRIYGALARMHARRNDWEAAQQAFAKALTAAQAIYLELTDTSDRLSFIEGQEMLFAEMRTCLRALGKEEEAGRVEARVTTSPQEAEA